MPYEYRVGEAPRVYPDTMSEVYPRGLAPLLRFWHQSSSDELVQCARRQFFAHCERFVRKGRFARARGVARVRGTLHEAH